MTLTNSRSWCCAALMLVALGCGSDVPLGSKEVGTGGSPGSGGKGTGGAVGGAGGSQPVDAPIATGGQAGSGGAPATGGQVGSGGASTTIPGSGGKTGSGGSTGTAGATCGTIAGLVCPAGQFCDMPGCIAVPDGAGVCMPTGGGCTTEYQPVCGCDGKTYPNNCERIVSGVLKAADGACAGGTGGKTGTGGSAGTGGTRPGTGGIIMDGGAPGSGGQTGTGGITAAGGAGGTGGAVGSPCGSTAATTCPGGTFCDLASNCGQLANAAGTCQRTGPSLSCTANYAPVCGCDGRTYSNDCARMVVGMLKAADGACASADGGTPSYATAYLAWQGPGGVTGMGPALVASGAGWLDTWDSVTAFPSPESPPSNATDTFALSSTQVNDLFARVNSVNTASLPHDGPWAECTGIFYYRACASCTPVTFTYDLASQVAPEMDSVWSWFDNFLGATVKTNPRNYCNFR